MPDLKQRYAHCLSSGIATINAKENNSSKYFHANHHSLRRGCHDPIYFGSDPIQSPFNTNETQWNLFT